MSLDLAKLAQKYGLDVVIKETDPRKLKLDLRGRWKCMFGCENYGRKKSCPPNVPEFEECKNFLNLYKKALVFKFKVFSIEDVKKAQEFLIEAERSTKLPYALALFPGGCLLCDDECRLDCPKGRPSLSALYIDATQFDLKENEMVAMILLY